MLARVELSYQAQKEIEKLSFESYNELRERVWGLQLPEWKDPAQDPHPVKSWYRYGETIMADLNEEVPWLKRFSITHTIKDIKGHYKVAGQDAVGNTTNISVHLPNIGLLMITEVTWLDDACTQDLQRHLDDGWRIIAVCPPNGTRRPDYILGRSKEQ